MNKIGIIGAGTMGNGIAHVFALYGYNVTLVDVSDNILKNAFKTIEKNLNKQLNKNLINNKKLIDTLNNIRLSTNVNSFKTSDLVDVIG